LNIIIFSTCPSSSLEDKCVFCLPAEFGFISYLSSIIFSVSSGLWHWIGGGINEGKAYALSSLQPSKVYKQGGGTIGFAIQIFLL
jgi:hypothetical protein